MFLPGLYARRWLAAAIVAVPLTLTLPLPGAQAAPPDSRAGATHHVHVIGYLTDRHPATDNVLDVYSKAHSTTYHVTVTSKTVVKIRTQVVARSRLQYHTRVYANCDRGSGNTLVALTIHIELPRAKHSKSKTK